VALENTTNDWRYQQRWSTKKVNDVDGARVSDTLLICSMIWASPNYRFSEVSGIVNRF
jgi:hypothetical protein